MIGREPYTPWPAFGARVNQGGAQKEEVEKNQDKWMLILVRELCQPPEKVRQALTDPAQLGEWAREPRLPGCSSTAITAGNSDGLAELRA